MSDDPTAPVGRVLGWANSPDYAELAAERAGPPDLVAEHGQRVGHGLAELSGPRWHLVHDQRDGQAWQRPIAGAPFTVIWSLAHEDDARLWLHVSASHRTRLPTWDEMAMVKRLFVGPERWACQLHPPEAEHVNLHSRVLHLWAPWYPEHRPLPDFTHEVPGGGRTL